MPADIRQLAQEAIGLAGKATPGPWVQSDPEFGDHDTSHFICSGDKEDPAAPLVATAEPRMDSVQAMGDAGLIAHAGTHYATIARELLEALDGKLKAAHALADQVDETLRAKRERDEARGANILNRNAVRRLSAEKDAILADLPHALGTCGCRPTTPTVEWGEGDWPSEHTAAVERLKERIA